MQTSAHHLLSALFAGMFGATLLVTAHLFAEYRATKLPSFQMVHFSAPASALMRTSGIETTGVVGTLIKDGL